MFRYLCVILLLGASAIFYTDLESNSLFESRIFPVFFFISLVSLAIWFVVLFHKRGIKQTINSGDVS